MSRTLTVTWTPRACEPHPCAVCSDSALSFLELLSSVIPMLERDGIEVFFGKDLPAPDASPDDTGFFLNDRPLEDLLRECDRAQFICHSSRCQTFVPAVEIVRDERGARCIRAPEMLFRKAILMSLEKEHPSSVKAEGGGYDCASGRVNQGGEDTGAITR